MWCQDFELNGIQHNDTLHKGLICDIQNKWQSTRMTLFHNAECWILFIVFKMIFIKNIICIVKNTFGFTILYWYSLHCYWQVLQTSTDPDRQFSAPFKAGNSRQVQTCYKPMVQTQRKLQHFLVYTSIGETGVLMTLKHWASTLAALLAQTFALLAKHKLRCFCLSWVKQYCYHVCKFN